MEKFAILLAYFDKQTPIIHRLYKEIISIDLSAYPNRYVFAMKTQQLYTAIEDLFKQIAKSFENHIHEMKQFHKELLIRMNMEIPKIRPAVLTKKSSVLLDKVMSFRHFVRHAYDCELDEEELKLLQERLNCEFCHVEEDLQTFRFYLKKLAT